MVNFNIDKTEYNKNQSRVAEKLTESVKEQLEGNV